MKRTGVDRFRSYIDRTERGSPLDKKTRFLVAALALALLTGCQSAVPSQGTDEPQPPAAPAEAGGGPVRFTAGTYLCGDVYFSFYADGVSGSTTGKDSGIGLAFAYEVDGDAAVFLTGSKTSGAETYQLLHAFVVEAAGDSYEVTAMRSGQYGVPAGFTAYVLATDEMTVIFGDTDTRNFNQAKVELADGLFELRPLTGYRPYLIALDYRAEVSDAAFTDEMGYEVRYSEYFSNDLMADSASAAIPPRF